MTDTITTKPKQPQAAKRIPDSWEATPYGEHWSFAYTPERHEREDYDFSVEFHEGMSEAEQRAVIALLEAAPKLLALAQAVLGFEIATPKDYAVKGADAFSPLARHLIDLQNQARDAIAETNGRGA